MNQSVCNTPTHSYASLDALTSNISDVLTVYTLSEDFNPLHLRDMRSCEEHGPRATAMAYAVCDFVGKHGPRNSGWEARNILVEMKGMCRKAWKIEFLKRQIEDIDEWYAWGGYNKPTAHRLIDRANAWCVPMKLRSLHEMDFVARSLMLKALRHPDAKEVKTTELLGYHALERVFKAMNGKTNEAQDDQRSDQACA